MHQLFVYLLFLVLCCGRNHGIEQPPNIVFIVADDLGWNDVGFNGGDVRTPNLDALAAQGVIISRHYSLPSCSPSRAALLTAKYPMRNGIYKPFAAGVPESLPLSEKIFPQYFKELDYRTHLVGKWHLGYQTRDHIPTKRGFDSFFGFLNGYLSYYDATHTQTGINGRDLRRNEKRIAMEVYGKYLTGVMTEEARSVIRNHPSIGGLLMFLMYSAPHTGNLNFYREAPPGLTGNETGRQVFKEMVKHMDKSVGDVVTELNSNGLLNNTIIVFISDNGAPTVDQLYHYDNFGSNWPLRGEKMSNRDGGVRTPSFIWSPMLKHNSRVSHQLFHITDWLPTLYSAAGGNPSRLPSMDGVDQWKSLISSTTPPRTELLVEINQVFQSESYILGKWKVVKDPPPDVPTAFAGRYYGDSGREMPYDEIEVSQSEVGKLLPKPKLSYLTIRKMTAIGDRCNNTEEAILEDCYSKYCLYNLLEDPSECNNKAHMHPEILEKLVTRLDVWRMEAMPALNLTVDPNSNPKYFDDYWSPWIASCSSAISMSKVICIISLCMSFLKRIFGI